MKTFALSFAGRVVVALFGTLAFTAPSWAQDEPLMDGMGNVNTEALNADSPAARLYEARCAQCHDNPVGRIPPRASLRYRPAEGVYEALVAGTMSPMTQGLSDAQVKSLVKLLTGREPREITDPRDFQCDSELPAVAVADGDWSNIQGGIQGHRYRDVPGFSADSVERLQIKWAYAYPGGAAGPATLGGDTIFLVGTGYVLALNAESGCLRWAHSTPGRVVRAVTVANTGSDARKSDKLPASVALFGDDTGTVHALDASTGDALWQRNVADHVLTRITASPTVYDGVAYVPISSMEDPLTHDKSHRCCTARGGVAAVSLSDGELLWKQQHITDPLQTLESAAPEAEGQYSGSLGPEHGAEQFQQGPAGASTYLPLTVDAKRGLVYASTAEEYGFTGAAGPYSVIAYDLKSGERAWQQSMLPSPEKRAEICAARETDCRNFFSMGTAVLLQPLGDERDILVVGQKSGVVTGLDPDDGGKVVWQVQASDGGDLGGMMYSLASDGEKIYVPVSDVDSPTGRHTGSLLALDPASGRELWRTPAPEPACNWDSEHCIGGQVAAVTVVSDMVFTGFWDGYVRIYATSDGHLLREIDTAIDFAAVNGTASGGQVSGYPVTVGKDALFITSGASSVLKPGNALLVYTLEGE